MIARQYPSTQGDLSTSFRRRGPLIHEPSTTVSTNAVWTSAPVMVGARKLGRVGAYAMVRRNPQMGQLATPERASSARYVVQPFVPQ